MFSDNHIVVAHRACALCLHRSTAGDQSLSYHDWNMIYITSGLERWLRIIPNHVTNLDVQLEETFDCINSYLTLTSQPLSHG